MYKQNIKILDSTKSLIDKYTQKHNKSIAVRFDLRYPQDYEKDTNTNKDISLCIHKVITKYKRQKLDPAFIWVREQDTSPHPHYHCAVLFNGSKVRAYNHIFKNTEALWKSTLDVDSDGLLHSCMQSKNGKKHENGILLDRNAENYQEKLQDVHRQISYLAKSADKGIPNDGLRDFGMSRLNTIKK